MLKTSFSIWSNGKDTSIQTILENPLQTLQLAVSSKNSIFETLQTRLPHLIAEFTPSHSSDLQTCLARAGLGPGQVTSGVPGRPKFARPAPTLWQIVSREYCSRALGIRELPTGRARVQRHGIPSEQISKI